MMTKVIIVTTVREKVIKVFNANFEKGDLGTRTMTKHLRLHPSGIPKSNIEQRQKHKEDTVQRTGRSSQ